MHLTHFEGTKVIGKEGSVAYKPGCVCMCLGGCFGHFVTCVVSHVVLVLRHNYRDFSTFCFDPTWSQSSPV